MRTLRLIVLFVGVALVATTFCVMKVVQEASPSLTLGLENIEALASGESSSNSICIGSGSIYCPATGRGAAYVGIGYKLR